MSTGQPTATATPSDLAPMSNDELLELYQQISSRVGMYNTEVLIQRMFEIRKELNRRMGELAEAKREATAQGEHAVAMTELAQSLQAALAEAKAEVARLDGVKNQLERTGFQTVTQLADAWLSHQNTFKSQTTYVVEVEARESQLRARVAELEADKVRLIDCINEVRRHMHEPHGGHIVGDGGDSVSREKKMMFHSANKALDAAIDAARKGQP